MTILRGLRDSLHNWEELSIMNPKLIMLDHIPKPNKSGCCWSDHFHSWWPSIMHQYVLILIASVRQTLLRSEPDKDFGLDKLMTSRIITYIKEDSECNLVTNWSIFSYHLTFSTVPWEDLADINPKVSLDLSGVSSLLTASWPDHLDSTYNLSFGNYRLNSQYVDLLSWISAISWSRPTLPLLLQKCWCSDTDNPPMSSFRIVYVAVPCWLTDLIVPVYTWPIIG